MTASPEPEMGAAAPRRAGTDPRGAEERPWPGLDVSGLHILVTGFGVSGYAVADQTLQRGARVTVVDAADTERAREQARILEVFGLRALLGPEHTRALPEGDAVDLVVTSPGWRPDQPLLAQAAASGVPIWSEVELARRMQGADGPAWLGVTGTNGKTTTVTMLESILQAAGLRAVACGNVGLPVIEAALDPEGFDVLAVELSSFQLHWTQHLHCESAVVLNLSEDHLDWHGSFAEYAAAKGRIYEGVRTACVYATADGTTRRLVEEADVEEGARAVGIGLGSPGLSELGVVEGMLVDRAFIEDRRTRAAELGTLEDLAHLGPQGAPPHIVLDALAAAALARAHGVPQQAVRDGLRGYRAGAHRAEVVASGGGVVFVDDSKATNPDAARASLVSAERIVWIAGGLTKGADVDSLVASVSGRLTGAVLIGEDDAPFRDALARHAPALPLERPDPGHTGDAEGRAEYMRRVVRAARSLAGDGDVVLLAPAAASMDQFANYAERGDLFAAAAREIADANG